MSHGSPADEAGSLEQQLVNWDGEHVVCRHDRPTGAWFFICVHSTALGVGAGGTRMQAYPSPSAALADAMDLSRAMTRKLALADLPYGGAKGVIAVNEAQREDRRQELLMRYAQTVASLRGAFWTSGDVNVSTPDLDAMSRYCPYLFATSCAGTDDRLGAVLGTAIGTMEGIRSTLGFATGDDALLGRTVLVQGVGEVGAALAELLAQEGVRVLVSDIRADRADAVAARTGATTVPTESVLTTPCDVLSPCAVGGVIGSTSVGELRCSVIAGSANNPLADADAAQALQDAGILYAPDFVISAGGVLEAIGTESLDWSAAEVDARLRRIGETLEEVYRTAEESRLSTEQAALALVERQLSAASSDQHGGT